MIDTYTLLGAWPDAEVDLSVDSLAAAMNARGVGRSLVAHTTAIFYSMELGNRAVQALATEYAPLVPVAVINPLDYPACLREVDRCLEEGLRVFRFCPLQHGYPFSGSVGPLREVLRRLAGARLLLADLAGAPAPILTADIDDLLPAPTALSVDGSGLGTLLQAARLGPHLRAETSHLTAGGALEAAVEHMGANRVLFGSQAPLRALGPAVMSVQYAELSEADRQAIFEDNAQRLLDGGE